MRTRWTLGAIGAFAAAGLMAGSAAAQPADQGNAFKTPNAETVRHEAQDLGQGQPVSSRHLHHAGAPSADSVLMQQARMYARPGSFYLTGDQRAEIAHFSSQRDLSVCVARPSPLTRSRAFSAPAGRRSLSVPLDVSWHGQQARVRPGNCLYFDAAHVTIRPARPLPPGDTVHGQIRALGHYSD